MTDYGVVERTFRASRGGVCLQFALITAITCAFALWIRSRSPQSVVFVLSVGGAVMLYACWPLLQLLMTGTAVVITDRGLVNRTGGFTFVAWNEIREARLRRYLCFHIIDLYLYDPEPMLQRISPLSRLFMRGHINSDDGKPSIQASFIQDSPEVVLGLIKSKLRAAHEAA